MLRAQSNVLDFTADKEPAVNPRMSRKLAILLLVLVMAYPLMFFIPLFFRLIR